MTARALVVAALLAPARAPTGTPSAPPPSCRTGSDRPAAGCSCSPGFGRRGVDPARETWLRSYTILTGPPSPVVEPLHDRMPVVLERADWAAWIDPELPAEAARDLLAAAGAELEAVPVSTRVNSVAHDDPECLAPRAEQLGLFF